MDVISGILNFLFHIDTFLGQMIIIFGVWLYVILFIAVFCETGLVVTPFMPGDSLIFVAGAFAAKGDLNLTELFIIFAVAAVLGDTVNYSIGHYIGPRAFTEDSRFLKKDFLFQAQEFYEKHGFAAVYICRFFPVIRTFAPFVAGIGSMKYRKFVGYNISGALSWVSLFLFVGFFFGNIPWIQANMSLLVYGIILISSIPGIEAIGKSVIQSIKTKRQKRKSQSTEITTTDLNLSEEKPETAGIVSDSPTIIEEEIF
jgi:membrane-associated protein